MIDYPLTPALNDTVTAPNGVVWVWNGSAWVYQSIPGGGGDGGSGFTFIQDTAPTPVKAGDTWFNNSTGPAGGVSYLAMDDGSGALIWVQFSPGTASAALNAEYALGIVAWGSFIGGSAYQLPAGITTISNPLAFTTAVGRRYRLCYQIRVIASTAGNGINLLFAGSGVDGSGWDIWHNAPVSYSYMQGEAIFSGTGVASSYALKASVSVGVAIYLDTISNFYLEDVGPVR